MKKMIIIFALAFACLSASTSAQVVPQSRADMQMSFAPLVKKTSPAVVNIYTRRVVREQLRVISPFFNDPFFGQFFGAPGFGGPVRERERIESSLGSGVIVDPAGLIATNTHVIKGATEIIVVTADGREFEAEKALLDEKTDLAVLRISPKGETLAHLELADSDALEVGDIVLAIGNPFGVGQTVTSGIISGLARTGFGPTDYRFFIQTDAAINPGNSGGALIDMQGRLIGINSMIFSRAGGGSIGLGFAIPSSMVAAVIDASRHGDKLIRPWAGVNAQAVTSDVADSLGLPRALGALVNKVHAKGPADRAGLRVGDVITAINGRDVRDPDALRFRLATVPLGTSVRIDILRAGKKRTLSMVTEAPPENPPRDESLLAGTNPLSGAVVVNISPAVTEETGGLGAEEGVVVMRVEDGNAARLGISPGDVIARINGQDVKSVRHLRDILANAKTRRWQIQVLRDHKTLNLMITL